MSDIQTRADIELLMEFFYAKLLADNAIGYIFTDVAQIDLEQHLPHIIDFWEQTVLHSGNYRKNVLQIHLDLNAKEPLSKNHFEIWLDHFNATIDENFKGANCEIMKTRALSVANVMQIKLQ
jgi:hemoglobin